MLFGVLNDSDNFEKELDFDLNSLISKINNDLLYIPNIIHNSVPIGKDESSNEIIREWGEKPEFNFKIKGQTQSYLK
jgi:seryl-tRNA synthetase